MNESDIFKILHPREYYKVFLRKGVRPDGRNLTAYRNLVITRGVNNRSTCGSSLVRIGKTTVLCSCDTDVEIPKVESPEEGRIDFFTQLPNIASHKFDNHSIRDETTYDLTNFVESYVKNIVNLEELCIEKSKAVFVVKVNISVLIYDGNLYDAFLIAALTALEDLIIPGVEYDDDEKQVTVNHKIKSKRLKLSYFPISVSFGIISDNVMVDLCGDEEELAETNYSIVYNEKGNFLAVHKQGGKTVSMEILRENMKYAKLKCGQIFQIVQKSIKKGGK